LKVKGIKRDLKKTRPPPPPIGVGRGKRSGEGEKKWGESRGRKRGKGISHYYLRKSGGKKMEKIAVVA